MSSLTSGDSPPPDIGLSVSPVQTGERTVVQSVIECRYSSAQQDRHAPPPWPVLLVLALDLWCHLSRH